MLVYIYAADVVCEECGEKIRADLTAKGTAPKDPADECSYDSDDFPKGPTDEGESDTPSHCGACGEFLENKLTSDGEAYVIELVKRDRAALAKETKGMTPDEHDDAKSHYVSLTEWEPFYDYLDFGDDPADDDEEPGVEDEDNEPGDVDGLNDEP